MREIKFRAWDGKCLSNVYSFALGEGNRADTVETDDGIWETAVLMQYTGLKDKNGKEIYEGDVLGIYLEEIPPMDDDTKKELHGVMVNPSILHGRKAEWKYYQVKDMVSLHLDSQDYGPFSIDLDEHEVIGNIHQNPELLTNETTQ